MKTIALLSLPTLTLAALSSTTQNDVKNGGGCKAMTVLFARGTTEAGNMGSIAGPPFVSAIGKMMGGAANVAVQGIEYPADIPGFLAGGDKGGSTLMAQMVGQVRAACPDTALVMAGYSYAFDTPYFHATFVTDFSLDREANWSTTQPTCSVPKTLHSSLQQLSLVTQTMAILSAKLLLPTPRSFVREAMLSVLDRQSSCLPICRMVETRTKLRNLWSVIWLLLPVQLVAQRELLRQPNLSWPKYLEIPAGSFFYPLLYIKAFILRLISLQDS